MNREYHSWHSPALHRNMELLIFGHAGARVLVFPTSKGRFYEWEDRGMMGALGEHLEQGWVQLYCVDSVDEESWYAFWKHPGDRAWRHIGDGEQTCVGCPGLAHQAGTRLGDLDNRRHSLLLRIENAAANRCRAGLLRCGGRRENEQKQSDEP